MPSRAVWFVALDLVVAYLPMAWIAVVLGGRMKSASSEAQRSASA